MTKKKLKEWERLGLDLDYSDEALRTSIKSAHAKMWPEGSHDKFREKGSHRPPRDSVKISLPSGLIEIAEILGRETGRSRNSIIAGFASRALHEAYGALHTAALKEEKTVTKRRTDMDDEIPF